MSDFQKLVAKVADGIRGEFSIEAEYDIHNQSWIILALKDGRVWRGEINRLTYMPNRGEGLKYVVDAEIKKVLALAATTKGSPGCTSPSEVVGSVLRTAKTTMSRYADDQPQDDFDLKIDVGYERMIDPCRAFVALWAIPKCNLLAMDQELLRRVMFSPEPLMVGECEPDLQKIAVPLMDGFAHLFTLYREHCQKVRKSADWPMVKRLIELEQISATEDV